MLTKELKIDRRVMIS